MWVSGHQFVGGGEVSPPSRSLPPPSLPREPARAPPLRCTLAGTWVGGPGSAGGARPAALSPSHTLAPAVLADGAWPSPASSLVWGLGLWRWRVPPAVAPVGEGVAQGLGEPVVGVRIYDAEHRPPLQEGRPRRLSVVPRRPNHCPEDTLRGPLGPPTPPGVFPSSLHPSSEARHRRAGSSFPWWSPSWQAQPSVQFHHQGEGLIPQGVRDRSEVPVPGPAPPRSSRRLPLRPLCLRRRHRAPPPRRRGSGHPRRLRPRRGEGWLVLRSWAWGGDEVSGVWVDVVEVGVVLAAVVGVVRRHLLDAGGDAPHRLTVRPRGRPAPRPPPFAPPSNHGSHAPSCLSLGAHGALALGFGSLPGPHASVPLSVPWVPLPVTRALACTAGARALPVPVPMPLAALTFAHCSSRRSMRSGAACLGAVLAPLRILPVPWPLPSSVLRVVPSAARALSPSAAAGLGALPAFSPLLLAACPLARPLRVSLGTPPVASCRPLRLPWLAPCRACAPSAPSWITRRASCCLCSRGSETPGGERSGAGGRTCRVRPVGKGLGENGLGQIVWVWVG